MACAASEGSRVWKPKGCLLGGSQIDVGASFSPALTPRSILELACLQPCLLGGPWTYPATLPSVPSPGWPVDLCCSLVSSLASGPISFYSWMAPGPDSLTLPCLGLLVDSVISIQVCVPCLGTAPSQWRHCLCWVTLGAWLAPQSPVQAVWPHASPCSYT